MKVRWWGALMLVGACECEPVPPAPGTFVDAGRTEDSGFEIADAGRRPDAGRAADAGEPRTACGDVACAPGQRCEVTTSGPSCVDNQCSDLECAMNERCRSHAEGGHVCRSITCGGDVDCLVEEYCLGGLCTEDACVSGSRTCAGDTVQECDSSGSGTFDVFQCESAGAFQSECADVGGMASCTCIDDWDCPPHATCEAGACVGTGFAPTCTLPAIPFSETLPEVEIEWGGASRSNDSAFDGTAARNESPWGNFSHVMSTPIVANLDDDNGDGRINELDFPEIIFTSHRRDNPFENGVLRAIHGGGPHKGADYFARCGSKLWTRAEPLGQGCGDNEPDADSSSPVAVGDLDGDGLPEIVYAREDNTFRILDHTGAVLYTLPGRAAWSPGFRGGEMATLANLDGEGLAEVIVGRTVYVLAQDSMGNLSVAHVLRGTEGSGRNGGGGFGAMACPADLSAEFDGLEFVAGATLYRLPDSRPTCGSPPCEGSLVEVWHAEDLSGQDALLTGEGYCAIADVWGADHDVPPGPANAPDGVPEVILIDDGDLTILDSATGAIIEDRDLQGGSRGGAPNVDDFDGDGFMEIASALQDFYVVVDLQGPGDDCPAWPGVIARRDAAGGGHNPNPPREPGGPCVDDSGCGEGAVCGNGRTCLCLHNGWRRESDDDSSRATSSSVFDFNGDGAAEVLYNDECEFRVYDGLSGEVRFSAVNRSRTAIENPVVADVDNDGNAEVVTVSNTAVNNRCDEDGANPIGPNGVRVWGDPTDTWVSARRVWNQQSYHVVNVSEGGSLPFTPPPSWAELNGRTYNTYRSQPRSFGVAPDLFVVDVGVSSVAQVCGELRDEIQINVEVGNQGDLRVGAGVPVEFYGTWAGVEEPLFDEAGEPLVVALAGTLEPGRSVFLTVPFAFVNNGRNQPPDSLRVVVDPASGLSGVARECNEDNNETTEAVASSEVQPDLRVAVKSVVATCANRSVDVEVTVSNPGTSPARGVQVQIYAGDPTAGGTPAAVGILEADLEAGAAETITITVDDFGSRQGVRFFAVVDPADRIAECNEANNSDGAGDTVACGGLI